MNLIQEPRDYVNFRRKIIKAIETGGEVPMVCYGAHRLTPDELDDYDDLSRVAWRQMAQVRIALCHEALSGSGKMTKKNMEDARLHRGQASIGESLRASRATVLEVRVLTGSLSCSTRIA